MHTDKVARTKGPVRPQQLALFKPRGGKRAGAGRPAKGVRAAERHKCRPVLRARHPVHVVLRTVAAVGNLRRRCVYHAVRKATYTTARREDFRIVHISIQRTHIHLLVEASHKEALAAGMQGFQISAAKHINAALGALASGSRGELVRSRRRPTRSQRRAAGNASLRRRGTVFPDRYHAEVITSPRQARHALAYVMCNWRKHQEDHLDKLRDWTIDWYSSAWLFPDWTEYGDAPFLWPRPPSYDPLLVFRPRTWLLREGWKKYTGSISYREVPGRTRG